MSFAFFLSFFSLFFVSLTRYRRERSIETRYSFIKWDQWFISSQCRLFLTLRSSIRERNAIGSRFVAPVPSTFSPNSSFQPLVPDSQLVPERCLNVKIGDIWSPFENERIVSPVPITFLAEWAFQPMAPEFGRPFSWQLYVSCCYSRSFFHWRMEKNREI